MFIPRIYVPVSLDIGVSVGLPTDIKHYLLNVLRLKSNDSIIVFNGQGGEYTATLHVDKKQALVTILKFNDVDRESPLKLHLAQCISQNKKMDITLQKAVELGVTEITPIISEHSAHKKIDKIIEKRFHHWQGVIISACQQSGRCVLPILHEACTLQKWVDAHNKKQKNYILMPGANEFLLAHEVKQAPMVGIMVGPESGFSQQEIDYAITHHCSPLQLGPRILRTETAAISGIAILQSHAGDMLTS